MFNLDAFFSPFSRIVEYSLDLQNVNFTAIRTVRVLRPLKAINRVPSKSSPIDCEHMIGSHGCISITILHKKLSHLFSSTTHFTLETNKL